MFPAETEHHPLALVALVSGQQGKQFERLRFPKLQPQESEAAKLRQLGSMRELILTSGLSKWERDLRLKSDRTIKLSLEGETRRCGPSQALGVKPV
jgi:hypothetical protein